MDNRSEADLKRSYVQIKKEARPDPLSIEKPANPHRELQPAQGQHWSLDFFNLIPIIVVFDFPPKLVLMSLAVYIVAMLYARRIGKYKIWVTLALHFSLNAALTLVLHEKPLTALLVTTFSVAYYAVQTTFERRFPELRQLASCLKPRKPQPEIQ